MLFFAASLHDWKRFAMMGFLDAGGRESSFSFTFWRTTGRMQRMMACRR